MNHASIPHRLFLAAVTAGALVSTAAPRSAMAVVCGPHSCGGNTDIPIYPDMISDIDPVIDMTTGMGTPGNDGWKFVRFIDRSGNVNDTWSLRVEDSHLVVYCSPLDSTPAPTPCQMGKQLEGARIDLFHDIQGPASIVIDKVRRVHMFPLDIPADDQYAYSYKLRIVLPDNPDPDSSGPFEFCKADFWWEDGAPLLDAYTSAFTGETQGRGADTETYQSMAWDESTFDVVLVTGGSYQEDTPHVALPTPGFPAETFTIACANSAVAKTFLAGYAVGNQTFVPAPYQGSYTISRAESEAMMRMWLAEYDDTVCHAGSACTKSGTPLRFQNDLGWFPDRQHQVFEAYWDDGGALCLDAARHSRGADRMMSATSPMPTCPNSSAPYRLYTTTTLDSDPLVDVSHSTTTQGTTVGATADRTSFCAGDNGAPDIAHYLDVPGKLSRLDVDITSDFDPVLYVEQGALLSCNDDTNGQDPAITMSNVEPGRYYIVVDGFNTSKGDYQLNISGDIVSGERCDPGQPAFTCPANTTCHTDSSGLDRCLP